MNDFLEDFNVQIVLQWIPGHTDIKGNDRADTLAKKGSTAQQYARPVTQQTVKQIIKVNKREDWLNDWAKGTTGRTLFKHMPSPKPNDPINHLSRKEQTIIFRLRTRHIPLNHHLSKITSDKNPTCSLCQNQDETVHHILYECPALSDIRQQYLPPSPDTENTLYADRQQLKKTCHFYAMVSSRRATAPRAAGSDK